MPRPRSTPSNPARTSSDQGAKGETSLPLVALRESVHFPGLIHTLQIFRRASLAAIKAASADDGMVLCVAQKDPSVEDPGPRHLYRTGTICEILHSVPLPDGSCRVVLKGVQRAEILDTARRSGMSRATYRRVADSSPATAEIEALRREAVDVFARVAELGKGVPPEAIEAATFASCPGAVADTIAHHLPIRPFQKQEVLEAGDTHDRLLAILRLLQDEVEVLQIRANIQAKADQEFMESRRRIVLREQLRAIQGELDEESPTLALYRERLASAPLPPEARARAEQELARLQYVSEDSPESGVIRTYLDWLLALPWANVEAESLPLAEARKLLDSRHYGLHHVKERILEFLAVRQLAGGHRGPVLCFVGPPGVGKTSIGRSIASALGRPFVSVSLGGVSDEAEIRGHRRTYVGAMPGRILQSLKSCGASNPVFMLDEVDKLVHNGHGDPASALLEALDPAQNHRFSDHYLELPFDLSSVLFIATANNLASVPAALRDRLEIVPFFSYADSEREEICRQFILPKALQDHGLHPDEVPLDGAVVRSLAHDYTREAGLRALEREAASLARKLARAVAEGTSLPKPIKHEDLVRLLGDPPLKRAPSALAVPGIVNGLVVTEYGGDVATVEVCLLEPLGSEPHIRLTGNLGEIMQESAGTALTCVRSLLGETRRFWRDVHIHFAEGSVPKEGTSAGLAIALALASALDEQPLPSDLAVTGEITLLGRTLAVGGIREKLLGARRAGIKRVILPQANLRDVDALPADLKEGLEILPAATVQEAVQMAMGIKQTQL